MRGLGWLTGLEPATPGVTVQCSTIELQPPHCATCVHPTALPRQKHARSAPSGAPPRGSSPLPPAPPTISPPNIFALPDRQLRPTRPPLFRSSRYAPRAPRPPHPPL